MYAQTIETLAAMAVVFAAAYYFRVPLAFNLILASMAGSLVAGWGLPLRHFVEGTFGYFHIVVILCAGMVMIRTLEASGALETISRFLLSKLHRSPLLLLIAVTLLMMIPGALTGIGGVAVLSSGVIVAPILSRMGLSKVQSAAIIAMGAIFGMVAPPVNLLAMLIADGINMPYLGFSWILLILSLPPAIFSSLYLGLRHMKVPALEEIKLGSGTLRAFFPLVLVIFIMVLVRALPQILPDPSTPLILMVGAVAAIFSGTPVNFLKASRAALEGETLLLLGILMVVGILVQVMTLTGVRGLLVIASLSLPVYLVYAAIGISLPLLGGVLTSLGAASVLAVTFDFYFVGRDLIVTTAALSLICGLAELTPPTAISGMLSAKLVGVERYTDLWRRCWVPGVVAAAYGLLFIGFASYFSIFTR